MNYKKSEIKEMSTEELLSVFYLLGAEEVKEVNFGTGNVTKRTVKVREWVLEELDNRIGISVEFIKDYISKF